MEPKHKVQTIKYNQLGQTYTVGHIQKHHVYQKEQSEQLITMKICDSNRHKLPHYSIFEHKLWRKSNIFQKELLCKYIEGTR